MRAVFGSAASSVAGSLSARKLNTTKRSDLDLSVGEGLVAALKADTLSLIAWHVGMYSLMALAQFYFFRHLLGEQTRRSSGSPCKSPCSPASSPWLIKVGIKERM